MQVCELEPQGSAPWELLRKYGGQFGLIEKIKMGGVGSPKIKYISGLSKVDKFVEETAGSDIPHLNFELLKNEYFIQNRNGNCKFLNVLQGETWLLLDHKSRIGII